MRNPLLSAAIAAIVVTTFSIAQDAQAQSGARPGTSVAVIDVPFIFKNHSRFKADIDAIKKDIDAYKEFVTGEQQKLRVEAEKLSQYKAGSPEYKQIEESLARMKVEMQLEGAKKQKEFMEREAQVYYSHYRQVEVAVANFAKRHGIGLVLRFSADDMDPGSRESIMQGINRLVVYQDRLNITQLILDELNRTGTPPTNITTPVAPRGQY